MALAFLSGGQGQVPRGLLCLLFDDHDRLVGHGRDGTWPGYGRDLCATSLALLTAENAMDKSKPSLDHSRECDGKKKRNLGNDSKGWQGCCPKVPG